MGEDKPMTKALLLVLALSGPALAQEPIVPDTAEDAAEEIARLKTDLATLKADLLTQRFATLQAKANWIDRERILIATEERDLMVDRERVANDIAELIGCVKGYNLVTRACEPTEGAE